MAPSPPDLPSFPSVQALTDPRLRNNALQAYFESVVLLFLPALALSLLFFSSTSYTEAITKKKYSVAYSAYQERVGMFLPFKAFITDWVGGKNTNIERTDKLIWGEFYEVGISKNTSVKTE